MDGLCSYPACCSEIDDLFGVGFGDIEVVGVGARGEVLPAAVAHDEHDCSLVDLTGDLDGAGERSAGGNPREHAALLDEAARPLDRFARTHDALAVENVEPVPVLEHRRDVPLADVAQPLDALTERRLDRDDLDVGVLFLEVPAAAHQGAARSEPGDEVRHLGDVTQNLRSGALVVGTWGLASFAY